MRTTAHLIILLALPALCAILSDATRAQDGGSPKPADNHQRVTIKQGIWGNVWLWKGDFMPGPGGGANRGTVTPVRREVRIYAPASMKDLEPTFGENFTRVKSRLIKKVRSDKNGFYQVSLPPGQYSIFVKTDSTLYANWFDGQGNILPVTVVKDSVTKFQIDLTPGATY
jgi:hypothetical protein